jgi:hypothetical protein
VGGGGNNERVEEGEYGRNIMYLCMKMEKWHLKENDWRGDFNTKMGGQNDSNGRAPI